MKIEAVVSQVVSRQYVSQKGVTNTYYDAYFIDVEADPLKRFPGQIQTRPSEEEVKRLSIAEGARFTLHIMQVQEVRNGVPSCVVKYEAPSLKKEQPKAA